MATDERPAGLPADALRTLVDLGRLVVSELDLERVMQVVVDAARELTGATAAALLYRADPAGRAFTHVALSGVARATVDPTASAWWEEMTSSASNGRPTIRHDDLDALPGSALGVLAGFTAEHPVRSYLAATVTGPDGDPLGALLLGHPKPGRFEVRHELLLEGIVGYASIGLANAREHRAVRDIAHTLQRALLPTVGFHEGVEVAVRYRPAARRAQVGGDWYDALRLADGRLALTVGDVAGHDVLAAARMGTVRNALSVHVLREVDPGRSLLALEEHLAATGQRGFVTAVQALFDPADASLEIARAGHLAPLVVPAVGAPYFLDGDPAPPIGVGLLRRPPDAVRLQLALGDRVLFFTDGLVEQRRTPTDVRMARLRELVRTLPTTTAEGLCDDVLARFVGADGGDDDVAMLAIRPLNLVPGRGRVSTGAQA